MGDATQGITRLGHRSGPKSDLLIASLANLAISYNVVNIGLALKIMDKVHPTTGTDESLISAGAVLGMISGQLVFGAAGDNMGRNRALCYSLIVCFIGAVGCAMAVEGAEWMPGIHEQLIWWRIILGAGAGGVYPLAATLARASGVDWAWLQQRRVRVSDDESGARAQEHDTGSTAVALMFSMQGVGHLAAYFVGFVILSIFPHMPALTWRLHLGLGAVPPLIVILMQAGASVRARRYERLRSEQEGSGTVALGGDAEGQGSGLTNGGAEDEVEEQAASVGLLDTWRSLRYEEAVLSKLVGTAGSWFLFDVTFYGNQLYQEDVLVKVFGGHSDLRGVAGQDTILALVAFPGYLVSVVLIDRLGPRFVQVQGFVGMAMIFSVIGLAFGYLLNDHAYILMMLYSLTFFFSNFGPNSTTFMLPSLTFPDRVRSSLNGVSAAAGKLGALAGSLLFAPAARAFGVGAVLVTCAVISVAGGVLTLAFVRPQDQAPAYPTEDDYTVDNQAGPPMQAPGANVSMT